MRQTGHPFHSGSLVFAPRADPAGARGRGEPRCGLVGHRRLPNDFPEGPTTSRRRRDDSPAERPESNG
jgi:hypothetical protein